MLQWKEHKNPEPTDRARVCLEVSHSLKKSSLLSLAMPISQEQLPCEGEVSLRFLPYVQSLLCLKPNCQTLSLVALLLYLPREPFSNYYPAPTDQDDLLHSQWLPSQKETHSRVLPCLQGPLGTHCSSFFCLISTLQCLGQQQPIKYRHTEPRKGQEKELVAN